MADKIKWDGTNIILVSLFVEKYVGLGGLKSDYRTGLSVVQYGTELPLPIGHWLVALGEKAGSGVTVSADEPEEEA